jgi:uncharacterized coiled-coil protein SlyX
MKKKSGRRGCGWGHGRTHDQYVNDVKNLRAEKDKAWAARDAAEAKVAEKDATLKHMDQMDARRRKLCDDYETRLRELGEMLGARERERPAFIKSRDQLQKMAQYFEVEPEKLLEFFETIRETDQELSGRVANQGKELDALNKKIVKQARELTTKEQAIKERNIALDALHWVWCSGGCHKGTHRFGSEEPITAEHIAVAERNTKRLREWFEANERRKAREAGQG